MPGVTQLIQREMWFDSFATSHWYPESPRGLLGAIVEDTSSRWFKLHLQGWDEASSDYFTIWSEPFGQAVSRYYTISEQPRIGAPPNFVQLFLATRMRVYVEMVGGGAPASLTLSLLWNDAMSRVPTISETSAPSAGDPESAPTVTTGDVTGDDTVAWVN